MMKILVTGANGQLGKCIRDKASNFPECEFLFASKEQLDVEDANGISEMFSAHTFDYCINTAAYTNVEKAESEPEKAFAINAEGVKNLALQCKKSNTILLHISTDYVFDGKKGTPYTEADTTNPINVYGTSKLKGEQYIQEICSSYFILRTSWLYSQYGHNFLNTILKYAKDGKPLTITTEQTGTPTNANDLAKAVFHAISFNSEKYGIYNFSNEGEATWYDFTKAILTFSGQLQRVTLAKTDHYRTFAARPAYSVLDKEKVEEAFNLTIEDWEQSLKNLLNNINDK